MIEYKVGSVFPHSEYLNRGELTSAILNTSFFDVVCVLKGISRDERLDWKKGDLSLYLYEQGSVPFICVAFKDWDFDVSINVTKIQTDIIEDWLNKDSNTITLFLVDGDTNNIEAIRFISVPMKFAEMVRDICENQTAKSNNEVLMMIKQTLSIVSTKDMIRNADMKYIVK